MRLEKKATLIASITASLLAIVKLIVGITSGSVAVLASAIDSLLDVSISVFNYFALSTAEKEADQQFNFGRGKIEAIASVIEGVIITVSGLYILFISIVKIIDNQTMININISIYVMLISIILTAALVYFLEKVAKKTDNMVILADALHYKTDLYSNIAIIISLITVYFTNFHLLDAILGIGIAFYIIYSAYWIIKNGILMLLDVALEPEMIKEIKTILVQEDNINGYHYLQTRQSANDIFVSVHLVFNDTILLVDAHTISDKIEDQIKTINTKHNWYINTHLDPYDDEDIKFKQ